jgi:hypothetical protein
MSYATILGKIRGRSTAFAPLATTLINPALTLNNSDLDHQIGLISCDSAELYAPLVA